MTAFSAREIATSDGHMIVGRFFVPPEAPKAAVLLVPAMGVRQEYYAPLAAWLAMQGYLAATFDYRGCGLSRRGGLRGFDADIIDWAQLDCAAMVEALCECLPDGQLYWIGHSLGGQIFPFVPNCRRVSKFVMVATGSGYWRENAPPLRRTAWWLWYVVAPLAVRLFGYFPGKRLRKVGDLPRGVMEQWRRWCVNPEYAVGVEGDEARAMFATVTLPIVSISFTDDEYMSARNTESILGFSRALR
jgi:predicted alpha/beta hydrolase